MVQGLGSRMQTINDQDLGLRGWGVHLTLPGAVRTGLRFRVQAVLFRF